MAFDSIDDYIAGDEADATFSESALATLQSSEQREMMDLVDRLRRSGISSMLQLPQIVVCGDQSSGKSSVLEAITEIPFPRKENLCTRFATEIIMRRGEGREITCKINPDKNRPPKEQAALLDFRKTISDFDQLPAVIDEATKAMGLKSGKAFARDVLSVEIWGMKHPQMTLVDLPGLIHASSKVQSEEDVDVIKSLVNDYISEKRTIILAVVSAKNDYANQIILKRCREFDRKGSRTLGIITKPDFLRAGSENETTWLDLAQNKDIYFKLGWHILKNRSDDQHSLSFDDRNAQERQFFETGSYKKLDNAMKGVDTLRQRLSLLLFEHLKAELPGLKSELESMIQETTADLHKLGKSRATLADQRLYLTELFTSAWEILKMASNGDYEHRFFGRLSLRQPVTGEQNAKRFRAVVQTLNMAFAENIRLRGRQYIVEESSGHVFQAMNEASSTSDGKDEESNSEESSSDAESSSQGGSSSEVDAEGDTEMAEADVPEKMTRAQELNRVVDIMDRSRGRELYGTYNPLLMGYLFQEQSSKWEQLAQVHVKDVSEVCKTFVTQVLNFVCIKDLRQKVLATVIRPSLKAACEAATKELRQIIADKERHAITYNHYFTDNLQKLQHRRQANLINQAVEQNTAKQPVPVFGSGTGSKMFFTPPVAAQSSTPPINQDMSKFAAEQIIDAHNAFYKDEMKYFVGVVTKQVIERHLVAPLAQVLSPTTLAKLSDRRVTDLAGEPMESLRMRDHLLHKLRVLQEGQDLFISVVGS